MRGFRTIHERKSAILTIVVVVLLLFCMSIFGLRYMDPPQEYGLAVNFGNTDFGKSQDSKIEKLKTSEANQAEEKLETPPESAAEDSPSEIEEDLISDNTSEDFAIDKLEEEKLLKRKTDSLAEIKRQELLIQKEQEIKRAELDALMGGLSSEPSSSDGTTDTAGNQGVVTGSPDSSEYYSQGGNDENGDYQLGDRKVLNKAIYEANCVEGNVVVRIEVNRNGKVVKATPGVKGSTSQDPCLMEPARKAAMETTFAVDPDADDIQVGKITYRFTNNS